MDEDSSWESLPVSHVGSEFASFDHAYPTLYKVDKFEASMDSILPDDIVERILSFLPVASIIRATSVCKRWYEIINATRFMHANNLPQKPWYFMFTCNEDATGYSYDPVLRKWYSFDLPCIEKSNWLVSSSYGLVCFMDNESRRSIYICNPITRDWKRIVEPPAVEFPDYSMLTVSVDRNSHDYTIAFARSKQVPEDLWSLSIDVYESKTRSWSTSIEEILMGWRGGDDGVICNAVLYYLIHSTTALGTTEFRNRLIMHDLSADALQTSLIGKSIPVPCSLTCGRLMNVKERLVIVGGIAKYDRPDIIKGIGIWMLHKREWRDVGRMPQKFFQGFGELDDVFASSGTESLIYIQSYGSTSLLVFDMTTRQWKWSVKCPVSKRFPLQLFTGFCFEPRLEVAC